MTGKQILIVEDEKPIRDMIAFGLRRAGFDVREAEDCATARASIADARPDLLLIDWMLPDQSGLELTRAVKRGKDTQDLPVIMLTARADEHDKVSGLEGGADDYVTKPFSPRELLARINAVLRRSSPDAGGRVHRGGWAGARHRKPPSNGRRSERRARSDRVPPAAVLHGTSRARLLAQPVARPGVGRQRLRRGAHGRRAHPPAAQGARALRSRRLVQTVRGSGYRFSTRPE